MRGARRHVLDVAMLWARILVVAVRIICGIRLDVRGLENIPAGAALIASRHQSAFDTFVWLTLLAAMLLRVQERIAANSAVWSADQRVPV